MQENFVRVPMCTLQWCVCESLTDCAVSAGGYVALVLVLSCCWETSVLDIYSKIWM